MNKIIILQILQYISQLDIGAKLYLIMKSEVLRENERWINP